MSRIRNGKILRVAAYIRVSTQEQKLHGISLDAQKAKLIGYAKKHNMKIVEWYMDEGVSGRKLIKKRPELQRMIQDAEQGNFDRIIFIKLDRFFRSVAEYHECMKRIAPVIWTATEEEYDLSTANGRMLVNMKLTVAEMEADQGAERVNLVNEYKVSTGQPLTGSQPFGFTIAKDEKTGHKRIVRDEEVEDIMNDMIQFYLTHQSRRRTVIYLHTKYHITISPRSFQKLMSNTMLYGAYRGNPSYCEAYIDKATFERMQDIAKANIKENTSESRAYYFTGLIKCPMCGNKLAGGASKNKYKDKVYKYKQYTCCRNRISKVCENRFVIREHTLEKMLLDNIGQYLEDAKLRNIEVQDGEKVKIPKYDIEAINEEIDRLNYAWQTSKIRKVETYEKQYAELMQRLEKAEAEQGEIVTKDFSKVEAILHDGWKAIYNNLEDEYKRAFWRSFIHSIEVEWNLETKRILKVNFL